MQDGLENKIDRIMVMVSQLTTKGEGFNKQFKPKIYQGRRGGQSRKFVINIFIVSKVIKIDIDWIMEIIGFTLVVEYNMDIITEVDQGMSKIIEMTIEEVILEGM